jgi:leucyl-tRNA synthetase
MAQMVSPLCPHIGEELWRRLGNQGSVTYVPFPAADAALLVEDSVEVPVQVNGKVRARITVPAGAGEAEHLAAALADDKVQAALGGKDPVKTIVVPGRTVNLVIGK